MAHYHVFISVTVTDRRQYLTVANILSHTFRPSGVELLHGVIQADADRGKAHLPVQPCHQSAVQTPWALGLHHGEDGAKHTSVSHLVAIKRGFGFTLNLRGT